MPGPVSVTDDVVSEMWNHIFCSYLAGGIIVLVGLFMVVSSLVTPVNPVVLGGALLFVGFAQLFFAMHSQPGSLLLKVVRSLLFGVAGVWLEFSPRAEVDTVSMLLIALLLAGAGSEAITAVAMLRQNGWRWFLSDATASFLIAILIISGYPATALRGICVLVGVSVLISGVSRVMISYTMQTRVVPVEQVSRSTALSRRAA